MPIVIDHMALTDILGPPLFDMEVSTSQPLALPSGSEPALWPHPLALVACSGSTPCSLPLTLSSGPTPCPRPPAPPSEIALCCPAVVLQVSERLTLPGVAVGLAWTPLGGEIMFVEASRLEGEGQLTLTGQLGDVMKESAHLAISWLRTNAKRYQLSSRECVCVANRCPSFDTFSFCPRLLWT